LQGLFKGVIGADAMGDVCKPDPAAFEIALRMSGADASRTVLFEDSLKNLRTAKALGLSTLLIDSKTAEEEGGTRYCPFAR
jgi:putative hydrolase of the HAD superfamily